MTEARSVHLKRAIVGLVVCAVLVAACEKGLASDSAGPKFQAWA